MQVAEGLGSHQIAQAEQQRAVALERSWLRQADAPTAAAAWLSHQHDDSLPSGSDMLRTQHQPTHADKWAADSDTDKDSIDRDADTDLCAGASMQSSEEGLQLARSQASQDVAGSAAQLECAA